MGIWDRLERVIKSYIDGEDEKVFGRTGGRAASGDPDLDAAFEELEGFLSGEKERPSGGAGPGGNFREESFRQGPRGPSSGGGGKPVPEALKRDFAELGLESGASAEDCKAAYKRLLKVHHPDRHAGHPGNMKKATEKTARINAAYDRIEKWRRENVL